MVPEAQRESGSMRAGQDAGGRGGGSRSASPRPLVPAKAVFHEIHARAVRHDHGPGSVAG